VFGKGEKGKGKGKKKKKKEKKKPFGGWSVAEIAVSLTAACNRGRRIRL
jgi:hypothetical protein